MGLFPHPCFLLLTYKGLLTYNSSAILWFIRLLSPASIRQQFLSPPFPTLDFRLSGMGICNMYQPPQEVIKSTGELISDHGVPTLTLSYHTSYHTKLDVYHKPTTFTMCTMYHGAPTFTLGYHTKLDL